MRRVVVDALLAKVRELLEERVELGLPFPFPVMSSKSQDKRAAAGRFRRRKFSSIWTS